MGRYYKNCMSNNNELIASLLEESEPLKQSLCWRTSNKGELTFNMVIGNIQNGIFNPPWATKIYIQHTIKIKEKKIKENSIIISNFLTIYLFKFILHNKKKFFLFLFIN